MTDATNARTPQYSADDVTRMADAITELGFGDRLPEIISAAAQGREAGTEWAFDILSQARSHKRRKHMAWSSDDVVSSGGRRPI